MSKKGLEREIDRLIIQEVERDQRRRGSPLPPDHNKCPVWLTKDELLRLEHVLRQEFPAPRGTRTTRSGLDEQRVYEVLQSVQRALNQWPAFDWGK